MKHTLPSSTPFNLSDSRDPILFLALESMDLTPWLVDRSDNLLGSLQGRGLSLGHTSISCRWLLPSWPGEWYSCSTGRLTHLAAHVVAEPGALISRFRTSAKKNKKIKKFNNAYKLRKAQNGKKKKKKVTAMYSMIIVLLYYSVGLMLTFVGSLHRRTFSVEIPLSFQRNQHVQWPE